MPRVKFKPWDNECNISMGLAVTGQEVATVEEVDGIIKWKTSSIEAHFYEKPIGEEGGYEFEVVLLTKPASNVIPLTLNVPKNLNFHYQGELTPEEIAQGMFRPENVIGSWAVYHATKKNSHASAEEAEKYRTCKAFHIYRPEAVDAEGNKTWCSLDFDIEQQIGAITIPQEWLNEAVYPIVVDPTIGYNQIGTSYAQLGGSPAGYLVAWEPGTAPFTISSMHVYGKRFDANYSPYLSAAIYDIDLDNAPNPLNLLATDSGNVTINSDTPQWWVSNISYDCETDVPIWGFFWVTRSDSPTYFVDGYGMLPYHSFIANFDEIPGGIAGSLGLSFSNFNSWPSEINNQIFTLVPHMAFSMYLTYSLGGGVNAQAPTAQAMGRGFTPSAGVNINAQLFTAEGNAVGLSPSIRTAPDINIELSETVAIAIGVSPAVSMGVGLFVPTAEGVVSTMPLYAGVDRNVLAVTAKSIAEGIVPILNVVGDIWVEIPAANSVIKPVGVTVPVGLILTIAGASRRHDLERDTLRIEATLTYSVDTCSFRVHGEQPTEGEEVIVEDRKFGRLFAGIIVKVELVDKDLKLWSVDCDDYTALLDRRLVVETYDGKTADWIFKDIAAKYCSGFTANGVMDGAPIVEHTGAEFEYKRPSECFRWLCDYVGWHWQPDYYKELHFFSTENLPSPAPMSLEPGGPFRLGRHSIDTQGLRNRVYVRGGTMLSDPQTIQWKADGVARIWTLPWGPHEVSLTVSELLQSVGVENLHEEADFDYMMSFSEKYIRCSAQTATPVEGATISLTAKQDIAVITMVEDLESQEALSTVQGGDGIYEHIISDDSLISIQAAEAAGMADLREHANPRVKGSFETEFPGWRPGQLVDMQLPDRGVMGTHLVQRVTITPFWSNPSIWTYRVEYGGKLLGIADFLKALVSAQQKRRLIEPKQNVQKFVYGDETLTLSDELVLDVRALPFICGDVDAICGVVIVSNG